MAQVSKWQRTLPDILLQQLGQAPGAVAADIWEANYASQAGPNVIAFMREVSAVLNLDAGQRNALRSAVHQARMQPDGEASSTPASFSEGVVVAVALLTNIRDKLVARSGRPSPEVIQELGRILSLPGGLDEMAAPALGWFVRGGAMPDLSFQQLTDFVHGVYVALCTAIGPIDADQLFEMAVQKAALLREAEIFPPSKLIYSKST